MIKTIGIVGSGQMGSGIAHVAAQNGFDVIISDVSDERVEEGFSHIAKNLDRMIQKEKISESDKELVLSRIQKTTHLQLMEEAQLVVEAASENVETKLALFEELEEITHEDTILATNTSSISITKIANATKRPDKVIGMHFMNPVPVMKLIEVVKGHLTSEQTYKAILEVSEKMGKTVVTAQDFPGFLVNRVLCPYINEAFFALESGIASAEDIDLAMKLGTNVPMGPLTLADFIGLDTVLSILEVLQRGLGDDKYRPSPLLRRYVDAGCLGRKVGRGVFHYE
ncbi:MAG: 3-hydroxybutyryl-CoA dehydrogenase [Bdellovibrionales bacterium]|nr:3-hydroxybutyryl-CoA dehydrogenase [Bdellovibrionales bacterium]